MISTQSQNMTIPNIPNTVSTEQLQQAMAQAHMTTPLTGEELLSKVRQLGDCSKTELAEGCGYVKINEDGTKCILFTELYESLLQAKGVELDQGQEHLYHGLTFEQLLPKLYEQVSVSDNYEGDMALIHKYMGAIIINKLKNHHYDVANEYEKKADYSTANSWRADGRKLQKAYDLISNVSMASYDAIYNENPVSDYLSEISSDSLEVLEHFGAEAPILLNRYSCAVEDALIEQVRRNTQLRKELAELKGEEFDQDIDTQNRTAIHNMKAEYLGK
jgi:hypothetical protein